MSSQVSGSVNVLEEREERCKHPGGPLRESIIYPAEDGRLAPPGTSTSAWPHWWAANAQSGDSLCFCSFKLKICLKNRLNGNGKTEPPMPCPVFFFLWTDCSRIRSVFECGAVEAQEIKQGLKVWLPTLQVPGILSVRRTSREPLVGDNLGVTEVCPTCSLNVRVLMI